jgi:hypothetical protein
MPNEDMSNGTPQSSRPLTIVDDGPLRIHVGNIPFSWSDKHLREQFDVNFLFRGGESFDWI